MNNSIDLKELKIEVTQKCPLNCMHCSSEANMSKTRQLGYNIVEQLLLDAKEMNVSDVIFSGGEPLEWDPLCKVLKFSNEIGFNTTVYTSCNNFYENESLYKDFIQSGVKNVVTSLFGASETEHEYITRVYGSYYKTISSVKKLLKAGINVSVHFVAMKPNWKCLRDLVQLLERIGIKKVGILRFVPHGRGRMVQDIFNLNRKELKQLKKEIVYLRENSSIYIRLGSPFNILSLQSDVDCMAAIDRIIIGSDGIVYPCDAFKNVNFNGKLCSIYDAPLKEVWNKSNYLNYVRKMVTADLNPICSQCKNSLSCKGGCLAQKVIRYGGKYNFPDPDCLIGKGDIHE